MSDVTLTDFLLARIAEDEGAAEAVNRGLFNSRVALLPLDLYGLVIRQHPARVLAECEAKRRIIEDATNQHTSGPELDWVVRMLALPYADHPDYDESWRI